MLNNIEKTELNVYKPKIYKDVLEMDELLDTENELFKFVFSEQERAVNNQYIQTADEDGIKVYESMLHIIADPVNETLDFRRQRVMNRLSMSPPFTTIFLRQKLDEILGVGHYDILFGPQESYPTYSYPTNINSSGMATYCDTTIDVDGIHDKTLEITFDLMAYYDGGDTITNLRLTLLGWGGYQQMVDIPIDMINNDAHIPIKASIKLEHPGKITTLRIANTQGIDCFYQGINLHMRYTDVPHTEDIAPFTVIVESAVSNFQWYEELAITIGKIKPANIAYITRPLVANTIVNGETLEYSEMNWNYRLNGIWKLGEKPLASLASKGVIKMATTKSLKGGLFSIMGDAAVEAVNKVVINGSYVITDFTELEVSIADDTKCMITFTYTVPLSSALGNITKIEVYSGDDALLSQSNVYVPLVQDVELKHTLEIKEGV